ncbi:MAG: ABC transporter ATP-binding protein [Propionibacteriaceae bacterium]|nr:ABC transporter ATP-binding protein [Propionibacteriaceae bacterium]
MSESFSQLRLEAVTRRYAGGGESPALSELTLAINQGEFVALLGPSGCGKTTALNCVAGLVPLTSGAIYMDDKRVDTLPTEKRRFGMVFQNYALFPHLTVRRNVGFGPKMRKEPKDEIERQVSAALKLVRLSEYADRFPRELSGGQQQRVAIARAVAMEPSVVLMDEPLSNLDSKLRHEMRGELQELHRRLGLTTLYVTHDQEEALSLADRMVVLRNGRMQQVGPPEELFDHPVNSFVADFLGYRNLLPAQVTVVGDGLLQLTGQGFALSSRTSGEFAPGGDVTVAIRPDDIVVGGVGDTAIDAVIEAVAYLGKQFEAEVEVNGGVRLHLRTDERLELGQRVTLGVDPRRVMVYPGSAPADDESPELASQS